MLYIGSDPEFVFVKNGRVVPAYNILHQSRALSSGIGLDGAIATAEIRPTYKPSVYQHFNEIVLKKAEIQNLCNVYDVDASALPLVQGKSLGGHIHISTSESTNHTQKMVSDAIKLQFLLLPAAHFIFGRSLFTRFKNSNFKYGSPYDVRSDWGKNHVELRMLPTFLGLNDKNILSIFNFTIEGFTYLQHRNIDIPVIVKEKSNPSPLFFMNTHFPQDEKSFLKNVNYMYNFIYKNRIGFAIKLLKSINKHNSFVVARSSNVSTLVPNYLGVVYYLSQVKPRKTIILKHGDFNVKESFNGKIVVHLPYRIERKNYFAQSKKVASEVLRRI